MILSLRSCHVLLLFLRCPSWCTGRYIPLSHHSIILLIIMMIFFKEKSLLFFSVRLHFNIYRYLLLHRIRLVCSKPNWYYVSRNMIRKLCLYSFVSRIPKKKLITAKSDRIHVNERSSFMDVPADPFSVLRKILISFSVIVLSHGNN